LIGYSNVNGFSTTDFLSNNEFIASQSKTFLTPIRTMLSGSHVPMCHENVQWRLEFEFRGGASLIDDVAPVHAITDFTITDVDIIILGEKLSTNDRLRVISDLNSS